eukprot:CAMPEP_0173371366 /NCGR_PEP_ID=MMETSP1144-20121109/27243_1 /TAXON_ID=483371 /ORGANISM="non described non described, Strain CCMP2298" /LENGTH=85 /DNA_ID=CAMNT_0014323103 /DNA_START=63 /DNA_END=316 /DNA_ORIENTATION=+
MINLQGMFGNPRDGPDPRVAKTDTTTLSRGQDGILYKMAESRDWDKYRTLSEAEIRSELGKSRQIKEDMYTLQGKIKGGRMVRPG